MIRALLKHFFPKRQDEFVQRAISRLNQHTTKQTSLYSQWHHCEGTLLKDITHS
ncbi:MAG: hypothetical protein HOK52_01780 [Candidatus Marinimicrobia bacterium]|jgi:hypothetical protein|nr:hypothetical protein [Candidatus Neomarinimicrobiota bacterium]MBT3936312.1 hypothetical protein [Candidatus Neomarinimicrobiota bacterium]MBT3960264.1 hypothetical protein [Candidatus Neomarinimicrobiota bacterium]MBT4383352.1 hypothetical protein [Candidatus Neomarinimicrobiota bacterium]MBT4635365.1 hypothetical protein [Candidatus Neomarinimicrobiota bacterium]